MDLESAIYVYTIRIYAMPQQNLCIAHSLHIAQTIPTLCRLLSNVSPSGFSHDDVTSPVDCYVTCTCTV